MDWIAPFGAGVLVGGVLTLAGIGAAVLLVYRKAVIG